jgi:flagellar hook-associated protein 1
MGLSATLNIAQSALQTNANLTTLLSRNIAGVNDANYSRKLGSLTTNGDGSTDLTVTRASNQALFDALLSSTSQAATSQAVSDGLDQIEQTVNLTSSAASSESSSSGTGTSPSDLLGSMTNALQSYAASPNTTALGQAFLSSAQAMAQNLNSASQAVQAIRQQADTGIAQAVADANTLLGEFQTANQDVMKGLATGADVTDALDKRDAILKSLSKDMGITTVTNSANGGMSIYTDGGVTLFEGGSPRTVSFTPTAFYADGTVGNTVSVDGTPITGPSSVMPLTNGSIAGLTQLRDTTTVQYQNQLNQVASTLITAFADTDQTGGTAATIPGLFTYAGAPTMPTLGQTGLAAAIRVNSNADPAQGGSLNRIRDGNVGSPSNTAYNANPSGAASYSAHLNALLTGLSATRTFDATSGGSASGSLAAYASSSVNWLENSRSAATSTTTTKNAVVSQATTSLSNSTGVNLDDQLSIMLDLEHSYSASAELMSTVKSMFGTLINAMQ